MHNCNHSESVMVIDKTSYVIVDGPGAELCNSKIDRLFEFNAISEHEDYQFYKTSDIWFLLNE